MNKKQLKKLAKQIADLEVTIQTSDDGYAVNEAKDKMVRLTETADLEFEDMMVLDEMVQNLLNEKI
jgi:hypothetical protein